jgi:hypothetical protein
VGDTPATPSLPIGTIISLEMPAIQRLRAMAGYEIMTSPTFKHHATLAKFEGPGPQQQNPCRTRSGWVRRRQPRGMVS